MNNIKKRGPKHSKQQTPDVKYHNEIRKLFYNFSIGLINKDEYIIKKKELKIERDKENLELLKGENNEK